MPRQKKKPESEIIKEYEEKESIREEKKISKIFVNTLALISILGFVSVISESMFNYSIDHYVRPLWLIIMGVGFLVESNPIELIHQIKNRLDEANFNRITTLVIGIFALASGVLTLPIFNINHFIFSSMMSLVSFVSILFIIIETWILKQ
jgi:putative Mn2+ efflux pump MntP